MVNDFFFFYVRCNLNTKLGKYNLTVVFRLINIVFRIHTNILNDPNNSNMNYYIQIMKKKY